MAGGNLNNRCVEALGHAPLQGGLDGAVVRCDKIAASLAAPCRRGHRSTQRSTCCWRLGGVEDQLFRVGQILRKGVAYARLRELKIPSASGRISAPSGAGSTLAPRDPADSPASGAKAAMYTSASTFGSFPASEITAPP